MYSVAQIEGPFNNQFLPPFITMQPAKPQQQAQEQQESSSCMAVLRGHWGEDGSKKKQGNGFWISVSGFQPDRAYAVYRFFMDIGQIVQSAMTGSSTMRLKYLWATDCEAALTYDNQWAGYGADIHVRVKPEHPAHKLKIVATRDLKRQPEAERKEEQSSTIVTDIEAICLNVEVCPESELQSEPEPEPEPKPKPKPKQKSLQRRASDRKWSVLQWLKHKISYIFYL